MRRRACSSRYVVSAFVASAAASTVGVKLTTRWVEVVTQRVNTPRGGLGAPALGERDVRQPAEPFEADVSDVVVALVERATDRMPPMRLRSAIADSAAVAITARTQETSTGTFRRGGTPARMWILVGASPRARSA